MDESAELLPEDDSVFEALVTDSYNISSDAMLDDSFSSVTLPDFGAALPELPSSTPLASRTRSRGPPAAAASRPLTPTLPSVSAPSCSTPPTSRVTRSRTGTPSRLDSPRTRSRARAATPPVSEARDARPSSPAFGTRSRARSAVVSSVSSAAAASPPPRARTRTATPPAAGPSSAAASSPRSRRPTASPAAQPAPRIKCPECPLTYANERTYKVHKKVHLMQRVFSKIAKPEMFLDKLPSIVNDTLQTLISEKFVGKYALSIKDFAEDLMKNIANLDEEHDQLYKFLHEHLYSILSDHSSVFASSLVYAYYVGVNSLLNNIAFKTDLKKHIVVLGDAYTPSKEVLELFIGNFMFQLTNDTLLYFIRTIHGATINDDIRRKRSNDKIDSKNFLEMSHYIGGSVVSALLFKGNKYKETNPSWKLFLDVLINRFIKREGVGNACSDIVAHFTKAVDRGGLKHISQEAFDFFVVLFDLLMSMEGHDGSLPAHAEDLAVEDTTVLCLWDVLVGSQLDDDNVSLDFLIQIASTCKRIVMKGILKRQLNRRLKKAYAAVSLRSRLAG